MLEQENHQNNNIEIVLNEGPFEINKNSEIKENKDDNVLTDELANDGKKLLNLSLNHCYINI